MDWNDEAIARLRALWDEGHSTAEIGRRMSVSKNAVVGKAHRLNLPARPSPIRRDVNGAASVRPAAPRRITGSTLPPLQAEQAATPDIAIAEIAPSTPIPAAPAPVAAPVAAPGAVAAKPAAAPPPSRPAPLLRQVATPRNRSVSCCWPIGEPGTKSFRFCDAEAAHNKPYCSAHAQLAYVKVRDRRDEAAA